MNEQDVKHEVREIAERLRAAGHVPGGVTRQQGWQRSVWNEIQRTRPMLARHLLKRYSGDPYQNMHRWLPGWCR